MRLFGPQSRYHIALLAAMALLPFGCQEKETPPVAPSDTQTSGTAATTAPTVNKAMMPEAAMGASRAPTGRPPAMGGAPMMSGGAAKSITLAEAVEQAPKQDASLAPLAKTYQTAAATLKQKPNDPAAKNAYVEAAYNFGHAAETSDPLDPPVKYRAALYLYRKALEVDPNHAPSKQEKDQIEQIYRTMNRPIPQ